MKIITDSDARRFSGLTEAEAADRLRKDGPNELPSAGKRGVLRIAFEVLREPMFLLLLASGVIYLVLGEPRDALMLLGFVFVIMGITLYQERKTENALDALRDLSSPRALVIRGGEMRRIAGREVARGDVVLLSEGDRVPADVTVLESSYLLVDESFLTGESVPVRKVPGDPGEPMTPPGGDDLASVYSGTLIVQGQGIARVRRTGLLTELGKIGKVLQSEKQETTPLETETRRIVRNFALVGLGVCVLVVLFYVLTRGQLLGGLLAGITLAMAVLPEEIPVVLTVFLALGAWRMSQKRALTRRLQSIQAIGSATVLCVDKTGTLTLNRMAVNRVFAEGRFCTVEDGAGALPESCNKAIEFGMLAS